MNERSHVTQIEESLLLSAVILSFRETMQILENLENLNLCNSKIIFDKVTPIDEIDKELEIECRLTCLDMCDEMEYDETEKNPDILALIENEEKEMKKK